MTHVAAIVTGTSQGVDNAAALRLSQDFPRWMIDAMPRMDGREMTYV